MTRVIVCFLFLTTLIGNIDELPRMTILRPQASEILSDSEGRTAHWLTGQVQRHGEFEVLDEA